MAVWADADYMSLKLMLSWLFCTLQASIAVAGYPVGGDSLSVTKGIVSRLALVRYRWAWGWQPALASGKPALCCKTTVFALHLPANE